MIALIGAVKLVVNRTSKSDDDSDFNSIFAVFFKTIDQIANELNSGKEISKVNESEEIFFIVTPLSLTEG